MWIAYSFATGRHRQAHSGQEGSGAVRTGPDRAFSGMKTVPALWVPIFYPILPLIKKTNQLGGEP